jgi:twinkle protein
MVNDMDNKTFEHYRIDLKGKTGQVKVLCPKCSEKRKKYNDPCLSVNTDSGIWHCFNCEWSGSLRGKDIENKKIYIRPSQETLAVLAILDNNEAVEYLKKRGLSLQTILRNKIGYSVQYIPKFKQQCDCIQFPYFYGNQLVNIKYRTIEGKGFAMESGAEIILYGLNDIQETTIIVEGEIDKLSFEEAGFINCISVPTGGSNKGLNFLDIPEIKRVKKFIIAVDKDSTGEGLKMELIARLGSFRCFYVTWPEDCKDANEVLVKYGVESLRNIILLAKEVPIDGVYSAIDYQEELDSIFDNGYRKGISTGWYDLDKYFTVKSKELTTITGYPGSGKSEFIDAICMNMAKNYDFVCAMFSPENDQTEHAAKLIEKFIEKPCDGGNLLRMTKEEYNHGKEFVDEHFKDIILDKPTLDKILEKAEELKFRYGINILTIDPWNYVERDPQDKLSETMYVSEALSKLKQAAKKLDIHIFLMAHPQKPIKERGKTELPDLTGYDISGSAHFVNKSDNLLIIKALNTSVSKIYQTTIFTDKIKNTRSVGKMKMTATLNYIHTWGGYTSASDCPPEWQ